MVCRSGSSVWSLRKSVDTVGPQRDLLKTDFYRNCMTYQRGQTVMKRREEKRRNVETVETRRKVTVVSRIPPCLLWVGVTNTEKKIEEK